MTPQSEPAAMGLDPLEICFRIEKRFAISLDGNEVIPALWHTAGTLDEFVWKKLQGIEPAIPDIHEVLNRLQKAVSEMPRRCWWYPGQRLDHLLGNAELPANWRRLEQKLRLNLPQLARDPATDDFCVPRECSTRLRLAAWIIEHDPERVPWLRREQIGTRPPGAESFTREDCWHGVCDLLADVLQVNPNEITRDSHLADDLGMA